MRSYRVSTRLATVLVSSVLVVAGCSEPPNCDPQDVRGTGVRGCISTFAGWNGFRCVGIDPEACVGADCDELYASIDECLLDHRGCVSCDLPSDLFRYVGGNSSCLLDLDYYCLEGDRRFGNECGFGCKPESVCDRQHAGSGEVSCESEPFWVWNGGACERQDGCCDGRDCDDVYSSAAECSEAHALCEHCDPVAGDPHARLLTCVWDLSCELPEVKFANECGCGCDRCGAMDVRVATGPCEDIRGFAWNGNSCERVAGCMCEGIHCDSLFPNRAACEEIYDLCGE